MVRPIPGRRTFRQLAGTEMRGWAVKTLGDLAQSAIVQLIQQAAAKYGLDPALVLAQARQESGLNPNAVSPAGAKGVMQLLDSTAAALGVTNPFDPVQNIDAGVRYLSQLLRMFAGDIGKALAAYDWGPGNVSNAISQWGDAWLAHAPAETQQYVARIAGITPPAPASTTPASQLTIDAATGEVLPDATASPGDATIETNAPALPPNYLLLTALGIGAYLLADSLFGD